MSDDRGFEQFPGSKNSEDIDEKYSPFNPELDQKYPIKKVIPGRARYEILKDPYIDKLVVDSLSSSPANNFEAEQLMAAIVIASLKAQPEQRWINIPMRPDEQLGGFDINISSGDDHISLPLRLRNSINDKSKKRKIQADQTLEYQEAAEILQRLGYVEITVNDDEQEMIKPKGPLIEFLKERFA
ncbi:MAG: hypothetical protein V1858_03170 [Candidatus Gottesmanbacteria bacterium]